MYSTIQQIRDANEARGHHFFEPGAMRFFRSRIGRTVYGGRYFITSEQFVDSNYRAWPRQYTIRRANDDGSIDTVDEFGKFDSTAEAARAIKQLLNA